MNFSYLVLVVLLTFPLTTLAGAGNPVEHTHGDRKHSHPLPDSGTNHSHNRPSDRNDRPLDSEGWPALSNRWYVIGLSDRARLATTIGGATNKDGYIGYILEQTKRLHKADKNIETSYYLVRLPEAACDEGSGTVKWYKLDGGGVVDGTTHYVNGGATIGDALGSDLCRASLALLFDAAGGSK